MARSYRKTPIDGWTCKTSEKWDKRKNNRMFRRREKVCIVTENWDRLPYNMNEVRNTWDMAKDGKSWFGWMKNSDYTYYNHRYNKWIDDDIDRWRNLYIKYMRK